MEYAAALKKASLTVAVYLASAAGACAPDSSEIYDLNQGAEYDSDGRKLPRVVYIYQIFSHKALVEPLFYGDNCHGILPIPVHPNEILDGALINRNYEQVHNADVTYVIMNHPVIKELYSRHGKDLNFVGVIVKNAPSAQKDKERMAMMATTQAKYLFKADAAILTKEGGGHPQIDMSLNCEWCEELGIKTVLLLTEFLTTGGGKEESLIFNTDKADAIVSAGYAEMVDFPAMDRVLGGNTIPDVKVTMDQPFQAMCKLVRGSLSQLGDSWMMSVEQ
jgi:glycine reductase